MLLHGTKDWQKDHVYTGLNENSLHSLTFEYVVHSGTVVGALRIRKYYLIGGAEAMLRGWDTRDKI